MNSIPTLTDDGRSPQTRFPKARWWQVREFIVMSVEIARGRDPYADKLLAQGRSWWGWLEYAYMLWGFFFSSAYFIELDGRHVGVLWFGERPGYIYIYSVGVQPEYQRRALGNLIAQFMLNHARQSRRAWIAGTIAARNRPIQAVMAAYHGRPLGLSTATLVLSPDGPRRPDPSFGVQPLSTWQARRAWQRWRLHEVEHVAGQEALAIARQLLEALPRGRYVAVQHEGNEIGFAFVNRKHETFEVGLFTSFEYWSDEATAGVLGAIEARYRFVAGRLILSRSHANKLTGAQELKYERNRQQERYYVVSRQG